MEIVDIGVLKQSFMDFLLPSEFAGDSLYYCPQFGHFYCNEKYSIDRNYLDMCLLIYVCEGALEVETRNKFSVVSQDQIALIDCRYPHRYSCPDYAEFIWFHFKGNSSIAYTDYLFQQSGIVFSGEGIPELRKNFDVILSCSQQILPNEHTISLNIHSLLSQLAAPHQNTILSTSNLTPALDHIHNHYREEIDLCFLSKLCSVSTSHFIRSFKKYINCTPHEYLLAYRLRQSKQLLLTTGKSIDAIAEKCGFNSASHFARAFRKSNGMTPSQFRQMYF